MDWQLAGIALFTVAIVCEEAHNVSPILLAWTHPGLRRIALSRPIETMLLPALAIVGAQYARYVPVPEPEFLKFLVAPLPPQIAGLWLIWSVYWTWNIYHFGSQHYGVCRILGWQAPRWACVGGTAAIMAGLPHVTHAWWVSWLMLFAINFNHWLVDICLSTRVSKRWWIFAPGVIALGCVGLTYKVARSDHIAMLLVPWVIQTRLSIGIVHFLYSRWIWKLSDPQVRMAIGRDIFSPSIIFPSITASQHALR
jgi:hypothetical protein